MLIQTGSQELNKDPQTPLSTVTSSSLLHPPKAAKRLHLSSGSGSARGLLVSVLSRDKRESCARKDIRRKSVLPLGN